MAFSYVESEQSARIKVIGVGGAGGNAINNMIASNLQGVKFIAANTDAQALDISNAEIKIQLGEQITQGLGAGANPQVGREAAIENEDAINLVYILGITRRDRNVVEQTKSHGPRGDGMMTRRPDRNKISNRHI